MNSPITLGLACGVVSAVLFASIAAQTPLAIFLFYLTPLPVFLAGLGWGLTAGFIAALIGGGLAGLMLGNPAAIIFLLFAGVAPVSLTRLALMGRAPDAGAKAPALPNSAMEWYPLGRLIAAAALICGGLASSVILMLGPDAATYIGVVETYLRQPEFREFLTKSANLPPEQLDAIIAMFAPLILPIFGGVLWIALTLFNFWAAGKIVSISGRLPRPWPAAASMRYPAFLLPVVVGFLALSFMPGMPGILALCFLGAIAVAYLIMGIVVIRALTAARAYQPILMIFIYVSILIFWPVALIVIAIGLADAAFNLRNLPHPHSMPPSAPGGA